ncbi:MAG TPA: PAS domain S-box protein, partial [Kiritimatiellia bacterium]
MVLGEQAIGPAPIGDVPASWGRRLTVITFLTAAYFLAAKFGLILAFVHASATAVWPCTGLSLAALLLVGRWAWPAIFVGAFLANITTTGTVLTSIGIATGNTLEATVGATLVARYAGGARVFDSPQQIIIYTGLTALFSTTISATIGVVSLVFGHLATWAAFSSIWLTWWVGDVISDLVFAPFILLWATRVKFRWDASHVYEAVLLLMLMIYVGQCVFCGWFPVENKNLPLAFLTLPFLVWTAFRFTQRETATITLVLATIALSGTLRGLGPFAIRAPNESLILLQAFLGVCSITSLAMAAAVSERRRAEEALRDSEARTRLVLDTALDAVITMDDTGLIRDWNPQAEAVFGWSRTEAVGRPLTSTIIPERYREGHVNGLAHYLETGEGRFLNKRVEINAVRKDGTEIPVELTVTPFRTGGRLIFSAFVRDISDKRQSEERIRLVVESAPSAMVMTDASGKIVLVNTQTEKIFGYSRDELLGQPVELLVPERYRRGHPRDRAAFLAHPKARAMGAGRELFGLRKDGGEVPVEIGLNPIRTSEGSFVLASIV